MRRAGCTLIFLYRREVRAEESGHADDQPYSWDPWINTIPQRHKNSPPGPIARIAVTEIRDFACTTQAQPLVRFGLCRRVHNPRGVQLCRCQLLTLGHPADSLFDLRNSAMIPVGSTAPSINEAFHAPVTCSDEHVEKAGNCIHLFGLDRRSTAARNREQLGEARNRCHYRRVGMPQGHGCLLQ
jgi:hypothetical protein